MHKSLQLFLALFASTSLCLQLKDIERTIEKSGLHRDLITHFTLVIDKPTDLKCDLVVRENITKDTYIYLEEVMVLKGFEFWPQRSIDIERPSSASKSHEFIYRVPVEVTDKKEFEFVQSYTDYQNKAGVRTIETKIKFPFHYRYQPIKNTTRTTEVVLENPEIFLDCNKLDLPQFSHAFGQKPKFDNLLASTKKPISEMQLIPNGIIEDFDMIEKSTIGVTMIGLLLLSLAIIKKGCEKVHNE